MRTATVGLTALALALALTVVSCADGCAARETASSARDPAAAEPASDSGSAAPESQQSEPAPQPTEPAQTPESDLHLEPLPSTKPQPEPEAIEGMKSASTDGPPLGEMHLARVSGKLGPPVDVRYLVSGVAVKDQPVTLKLAFVPRLDGRNLRVEFPDTAGVAIETGAEPLASQKASKSDVLRHTLLVTPTAADSAEVRVIVSIDVGGAKYAGVVSIPVGDRAQKVAAKKMPEG